MNFQNSLFNWQEESIDAYEGFGSVHYDFSFEEQNRNEFEIAVSNVQVQMEGIPFAKKSSQIPQFELQRAFSRIRKQNRKKKISKKGRKSQTKSISDYKKNICGYIAKKIMRQFTGSTYQKKIQQFCQLEGADYKNAKTYYQPKIERVTGPSHIPGLFQVSKEVDVSIIKVFLSFFKWFLRERYVRHLFIEGKMQQKKAYIQYKNRILLPMVYEIEKQLRVDTEPSSTIIQVSLFPFNP